MPDGAEALADVILNFLVGGDPNSGVILVTDDVALHGVGGPELPHALKASYYYVDVGLHRQIVGIDERGNAGVGTGDGEVSS